jgi:hydrogenase nickel incorporation protein HypA/HybF
MHELSITENILAVALGKAEEAGARRISRINLVIGELTGVAHECVSFYFDFLAKDTIARGAALSFEERPNTVRCRACGKTFPPSNGNWACPGCGGERVEIVSGRELYVDSIEVDD